MPKEASNSQIFKELMSLKKLMHSIYEKEMKAIRKEEDIIEVEEKKILNDQSLIVSLVEGKPHKKKRFKFNDINKWQLKIWHTCHHRRERTEKGMTAYTCNMTKRGNCIYNKCPRNIK